MAKLVTAGDTGAGMVRKGALRRQTNLNKDSFLLLVAVGLSGTELFLLPQWAVGSSLGSPGLSYSAAGTKFISKGPLW